MEKEEKSLNVRRMVAAILLVATGAMRLIEAMDTPNFASAYRESLFIIAFWSIGIAIWYFVTLTKPTIKAAEITVKILFTLVMIFAVGAGINFGIDSLIIYGLGGYICYAIGCPWGSVGYKKHPYKGYEDLAKRQEKLKNEHK